MCNLEGGELILECAESFPNSVRWGLEWIRSAGFVFLAWAGGHCCEWDEIRGEKWCGWDQHIGIEVGGICGERFADC
jgi:hypothetical protein